MHPDPAAFDIAIDRARRSDRVGRVDGLLAHRYVDGREGLERCRRARWQHGQRSAETLQRYRLYRHIKQLLGGGPEEVELAFKLWSLIKFENEAG